MPQREVVNLFGFRVAIHPEWENHTVYRFIAPARDDRRTEGPAEKAGIRPRNNVSISRHMLPAGVPFEKYLEHSSREARKSDKSIAVIKGGTGSCSGQPAIWEETTQRVRGKQIRQRHIAIQAPNGLVTLAVVTADEEGIEEMSRRLGFVSDLGDQPARA
jgi:hypothetical protein